MGVDLSEAGGASHMPGQALLPHRPWDSGSSSEHQGGGPCRGPCPDPETPSPGAQRRGWRRQCRGRVRLEKRLVGTVAGVHQGARAQRGSGGRGCAWSPQSRLTKSSEGGRICGRSAEGDFPTCQPAGQPRHGGGPETGQEGRWAGLHGCPYNVLQTHATCRLLFPPSPGSWNPSPRYGPGWSS